MLMAMESSCIGLFSHDAASTLPADLNDFAVFNEQWNGERRLRKQTHALAGLGIGIDVVFGELGSFPLEPFAHLGGVRASCRAIELEVRHGVRPRGIRE